MLNISERTEMNSLDRSRLSATAVYGIPNARALRNFWISRVRVSHFPAIIVALVMVKEVVAIANARLGELSAHIAGAFSVKSDENIAGQSHRYFSLDMSQDGTRTSANINFDDVMAKPALHSHCSGDCDRLSADVQAPIGLIGRGNSPISIWCELFISVPELTEKL